MFTEEVRGMEVKPVMTGELAPVHIPIQMMSITDRDGKLTPIWFKFETEDHFIEKIMIEKMISTYSADLCRGVRNKK